jgi:hypothetical protein
MLFLALLPQFTDATAPWSVRLMGEAMLAEVPGADRVEE